MMNSIICLVAVMLVSVHGHAVLVSPTPWNPNPSTAQACGVATVTTAMLDTALNAQVWTAGTSVAATWKVVASDGQGTVSGNFDPLGGTNFTVAAFTPFAANAGVKEYPFTIAVPSTLDCSKSPTGYCTLKIASSSNWKSCTTVAVQKAGCTNCVAPPAPPALKCTAVTASQVSFCPGTTAAMFQGDAATINGELQAAYTANLANPAVFANNGTACQTDYQALLCSLYLTPCSLATGNATAPACHSQCQTAMDTCQVTPVHVTLYDCTSYPACKGEIYTPPTTTAGAGNSGSTGTILERSVLATVTLLLFVLALQN